MTPRTDTEKLNRLLAILNDRSDVRDGDEGRQLPNEAMSLLMEYEAWVEGRDA
jgi:hypothetical protein